MNQIEKSPIHQTLDQERAKAAWEMATKAKAKMQKDDFDKYKALVKRFPALVNHNGLGQTVAFLEAKKKDSNAEGKLLEQLNEWLVKNNRHEELNCYKPPYKSQGTSLSQCIMQRNSSDYILATREALAFLDYLRRFADSLSKESQ